ncbi:DNA polymerase subunit gamma-1, mitochondrial [Neodiprion fabricii]|uniref:DNA polymerase subunit gamma-1, mitochondrial n=1 Tax=Neodiprion fabricii TaxID=2872261 RepID=UPI001ED97703|nr:DNA polymerase subunit gamma-1, mitochondrial [Neodiprion fabricii]
MKGKIQLLNSCITRSYAQSNSTAGPKRASKQFSKKLIKLKKSKDLKPNQTSLTSNYETREAQNVSVESRIEKPSLTRVNELNMQMLSKGLYEQLFKNDSIHRPSEQELATLNKDLNKFGINVEDSTRLEDVLMKLPTLEGKNLEEHFYNIGKAQVEPYLKIINNIVKEIPEMPKEWIFQDGWTRYTDTGADRVDYPLETGLVFDVEVCMNAGPLPTLATAVSQKAWYSWVSKSLVDGSNMPAGSRKFTTDMLIPLESSRTQYGGKLNDLQNMPKIVVGHNVSYDRARIKEQYWLNCTGTRFVDTMSMHACVSGVTSYQRAVLKANKPNLNDEEWRRCSSMNGLADVHELYCGEKLSKKMRDVFVEGTLSEIRDKFQELTTYCALDVEATHRVLQKLFPMFEERFPHPVTLAGMLELGTAYLPVNSNWERYLEESELTYEDLNNETKHILAKKADETCKLLHNEDYKRDLWMWDEDWSTQSIKLKSSLSKAKLREIEEIKSKETKELSDIEKYLTDGEDEVDSLEEKFAYLKDTKYLLPARMPHKPGYPAWYRKLCPKRGDADWAPHPQNISTTMQITPKLLRLSWENYPLHYIKEHGWGFLVPYNNEPDVETKLPLKELFEQCPLLNSGDRDSDTDYLMQNLRAEVQDDLGKTEFWRHKKVTHPAEHVYKGTGVWCNIDIDGCCWFFKLPHKDGKSHNVGNPLAKDFLNKFSENILTGPDSSAQKVLKIARMLSYWRNNRARIFSQTVIWLNKRDMPPESRNLPQDDLFINHDSTYMQYGAIVPQVVVSGTLTRRAIESTWMTASNAHIERVGSELRAMIQAPPGYNIVGADVDSQELWIASVLGDAYRAQIHGATPFGRMTLIGSKTNGTDMHSVTAKAVGISRDHAKVINYARIYGAGQKFATGLLKQFNPSMPETEAISKAQKMFTMTKGKRVFRLKPEYIGKDIEDVPFSSYNAFRIAQLHGKTIHEMFGNSKWVGGTESAMFNRLEEIAGSSKPVTPFLNCRLSRALEPESGVDDKYLPTRVNWVVQSGAVDFLHLMLVCMRWLMKDKTRFCLSFHDEIRYLVPSKYKYNAALAMHMTNLFTRSFCAHRLGLNDLPMSVAFFTSVEVDTVLRKESSHDCQTPSNPHGLKNRYGVPIGESLNVQQALVKSGGSVALEHESRSTTTKLQT